VGEARRCEKKKEMCGGLYTSPRIVVCVFVAGLYDWNTSSMGSRAIRLGVVMFRAVIFLR